MKLTIDHLRARTQASKFAKRIKPDWLIATIGNNAGTVNVSGRDDRIWGLLNGDPNKLIQIERGTTIDEPIATTAVFVEPARKNAAYYRLIGRVTDWYSADAQADIVRGHASQHQRRDFSTGGFDPLDVYTRAFVELRARAQATPNWTLHVEAGTYINYLGVRTHYAGGNSGAFTKPAVVGQRRCDLLYFDNAGALQILQGTLTLDGSLPTEPTQPDQSVAVAYIYLDATMTAITEDYIFEARTLWKAIASTMPATPHNVLSAQHNDTLAAALVAGDILYVNATPKLTRLAANAAATKKYLQQFSGGAPSWQQVAYVDISGTPTVYPVFEDTEANILASTKDAGTLAYSTDTYYLFKSMGAGVWKKSAFRFQTEAQVPDIGLTAPMTDPSRIGYGETWLSDKLIANVDIGSNANTANASATRIPIRAYGSTLQIYVNGAWQTVVSNFVFTEDSVWGYSLAHTPVGFTSQIEVMSGTSLHNLGLNGLPIVNHYNVSMGAYPVPAIVGGRTIS